MANISKKDKEVEIEIFFYDLLPDVQKHIMQKLGITSSSDYNWDAFPMTTMYLEEDDEALES